MLSKIWAKIWAFLWPPIDPNPIEPGVTPVVDGPFRIGTFDVSETNLRQSNRVPPHQRYRAMSAEQRWSVYSSFRPPAEPAAAGPSRERRRAS
jgi:hypothetical protein